MNKSPLNFGLFQIGRAMTNRGGGNKSDRIGRLENKMATVMRDRNNNYELSGDGNKPEFATATESQPGSLQAPIQEDVLTPMNAFSPGTMGAANAMFGSKIPGSFDRDMGN